MTFKVGQYIGLIPLVWMALCWVIVFKVKGVGLRESRPLWFLAFAFGVSWMGGYISERCFDGSWAVAFFWVPVQLWLATCVFLDEPIDRAFYGGVLALLALCSMALSWPGPDLLLNFLGSGMVLFAAYRSRRLSLSLPVFIYFGLGAIAYFRMVLDWDILLPPSWDHYQYCRFLAYVAFIGITAPQMIHQLRESKDVGGSR